MNLPALNGQIAYYGVDDPDGAAVIHKTYNAYGSSGQWPGPTRYWCHRSRAARIVRSEGRDRPRRVNTKQQMFLDFVLSHCVSIGADELDQEKLPPCSV